MNCTEAIVPSASVALAANVIGVPCCTEDPELGEVRVTVGAPLAVTVTLTVELVVWLPEASTATAFSA